MVEEDNSSNNNENNTNDDIEKLKQDYYNAIAEFNSLIKQTPGIVKEIISRKLSEVKKQIDDGIAGKVADIRKTRESLEQTKNNAIDATKNGVKNAKDTVVHNAPNVKNGLKETPEKVKDVVVDKVETATLYGMEIKDRVVHKTADTAETIVLYGMEARDAVANKVVDAAETVALYGMETVDKTKQTYNNAKETVHDGIDTAKTVLHDRIDVTKEKAKQGVEYTKENAKKLALSIGTKAYRGAAFAVALKDVAVEGASKEIEKASKIADGVKSKSATFINNNVQKGTNYAEMATRKVALAGTKAKIGFKGFVKNFAQKVFEKVGSSLNKDQENARTLEEGIRQNKQNIESLSNSDNELE